MVLKLRAVLRNKITPKLRGFIATIKLLTFAMIITKAMAMLTCRPSIYLGGALALGDDPTVPCFTEGHTGVFVLAIIVLVAVGVVWPLFIAIATASVFCASKRIGTRRSLCCGDCCVVVDGDTVGGVVVGDGEGDEVTFPTALGVSEAGAGDEDGGIELMENPLGRTDARFVVDDVMADQEDVEELLPQLTLCCALRELGCTPRCGGRGKATRVKLRVEAKGDRAEAYAPFIGGTVEPQYFWTITVDRYTIFILAILKVTLVPASPTFASAIVLFVLTNVTMVCSAVLRLSCCPYHRADRWGLSKEAMIIILGFLLSATNMVLSFDELGVVGASRLAYYLALTSAIALPICIGSNLLAFLFSRALGCCKRAPLLCAKCSRCAKVQHAVERAVEILVEQLDTPPRNVAELPTTVLPPEDHLFTDDERERTVLPAQSQPALLISPLVPASRLARIQSQHENTATSAVAAAPSAAPSLLQTDVIHDAPTQSAHGNAEVMLEAPPEAPPSTSSALPGVYVAATLSGCTVGLPEGWEAHHDEASNTPFFYNTETELTQWTVPLRVGWSAITNAEGQTTFHHTSSGKWQMTTPNDEDTTAAARFAMNIALPSGWHAVQSNLDGVYYAHPVTGASSWEVPDALPVGWVTQTTRTDPDQDYFLHVESGTSLWERPTIAEHERAVAAAEMAHETAAAKAEAKAIVEERIAAGRAKRDAVFEKEIARQRALKKGKKKVRFKWSPCVKVSLADALLGRDCGATSSPHEVVPQYLSDVSRRIFRKADIDHDGTLSTMEILKFLRKRAKIHDTGIAFKFKETLHAQAEHSHEITEVEFERGLVVAMREDAQGPIAQWILRELQDLAAGWKPVEFEGEAFYSHPTLGSSWTKPELVTAMEHFEQLRSEAESGSAAEGGSAVPPSTSWRRTEDFPMTQSGGGGEVPSSSSSNNSSSLGSSSSLSSLSSSSSSGEEEGI